MTIRRLMIGQWPAGVGSGIGLRVSMPGKDAASTDDRDLIFSSDWASLFPIHQAGSFNLAGSSSNTEISFPDLGYIPFGFFSIYAAPQAITGSDKNTYVEQIPSNKWVSYRRINYDSNSGTTFLMLNIQQGKVVARYNLYQPNGNTLGWPGSLIVAYSVYRLRAA